MATDKNAMNPFEVETAWGKLPQGEFARMIGAGDPNEITADAPVGHEELSD
jgi:hypothetical protein